MAVGLLLHGKAQIERLGIIVSKVWINKKKKWNFDKFSQQIGHDAESDTDLSKEENSKKMIECIKFHRNILEYWLIDTHAYEFEKYTLKITGSSRRSRIFLKILCLYSFLSLRWSSVWPLWFWPNRNILSICSHFSCIWLQSSSKFYCIVGQETK